MLAVVDCYNGKSCVIIALRFNMMPLNFWIKLLHVFEECLKGIQSYLVDMVSKDVTPKVVLADTA